MGLADRVILGGTGAMRTGAPGFRPSSEYGDLRPMTHGEENLLFSVWDPTLAR